MVEKEKEKLSKEKLNSELQSQIEAILFIAEEPVKIAKIAKFLKIKKEVCRKMIENLKNLYKTNNSGLQIIEKRDTIQLVSHKKHGQIIAKFLNKTLEESLTKAMLEVMAIIVYRGPLTRAQIDYIRGVNSSFLIRNLAIRGLIEKKENPEDSRSYLYEASFDFLKNIGLDKLEDLPDYKKLQEKSQEEYSESCESSKDSDEKSKGSTEEKEEATKEVKE